MPPFAPERLACATALALSVATACSGDLFHGTKWTTLCGADSCPTGGAGGVSSASASAQGGASMASTTSSSPGGAPSSVSTSSTMFNSASSVTGSTSSSGGPIGCADGQREGFSGVLQFPRIAACAGGFTVPGVLGGLPAACALQGGDDGPNPTGVGCSAADLCAVGWHLCSSAADVNANSPSGCQGVAEIGDPGGFFVTGQSGSGTGLCDGMGANDLFGCGTVGPPAISLTCLPLDRSSGDLCAGLPAPWACGTNDVAEAANVVKPGAGLGGVLCCAN